MRYISVVYVQDVVGSVLVRLCTDHFNSNGEIVTKIATFNVVIAKMSSAEVYCSLFFIFLNAFW